MSLLCPNIYAQSQTIDINLCFYGKHCKWRKPEVVSACSSGVAAAKWTGCGPSIKHIQPVTVSLKLWFPQRRAGKCIGL